MDATPLLAGRPYKRAVPSTLPPKIAPWFVFPDSPWHSIVVETSAWTWQERYALLLEHPHLAWPLRLFGFLDDPLGVQYERASLATTNTRRGSESNMGLSAHAQHCDDDDVDGVCEVRGDDAWETEHLVPKRWPLRLIIVSIVYMLGFGASAFAYPGGPAAVTAEFGAKARVDVNAFFNMLFAFVLPWTIYHAVRDPMFVVLLRLAMVHDAVTTRMLVRRYFWGSVLLGSCFLCLTVAGFIVYWDDVSEYPVWLRFASFVGFYYFTFLFAFSLLVWGLVAHLSAMLLEELSESLLPDQFFAMIDAAMQASTDAVDEDAEALELDRQLGLRLRPTAGEKRVGVDTARLGAMMSPATTRDKEHTTRVISRVVESKIRQFHQASTIVQYMFDIFRPMLMLKCATDITLLFFGLAGTLDGGHLFVSTLLVVVVSLVVVFIVLSPAAYLTSLQRDIIFDVASLRPFATQSAQRASIESMINYLLPFSRRGGVRFFGMPITPALVVQVGGLFYSLIAAANFLR